MEPRQRSGGAVGLSMPERIAIDAIRDARCTATPAAPEHEERKNAWKRRGCDCIDGAGDTP